MFQRRGRIERRHANGGATDRLRRDAQETHEAIVAAARALMAERGPETLTVSDVAHRAGVNRTTAYQHFRTREALIGAVVDRLQDEVEALLVADMPLGARIDHMVDYLLTHPEVGRLWMFQMLARPAAPPGKSWARFLCAMRALAASETTQADIDPEMLGHILVAATLVWSLRVRSLARGPAQQAEATGRFLREVKRLLLFGVMKPEHWPELAAEVARAPADGARADGGRAPRGVRARRGVPGRQT